MADITYILNDPTTGVPIQVDIPPKPNELSFKVDGFRGATPNMYTLEHQAAMCEYSIIQAINLMNRVLKTPITHWAAAQSLYVQPRAGKQLNAYYDRQSLRFFYASNPVSKTMVYSVNSSDVVMHELGHALLDALRPDLFNTQAYEIWGFHEAFGDIHAICNALQQDVFLDFLLNETQGNLAQSNSLTRMAEEMGQAVYDLTSGKGGHTAGSLRNAFNSFIYQEPEKLPRAGFDNQLTSEPHSFARVFVGAWYDILCAIYDVQKKTTTDLKMALINARDILTSYTYNAIPNAPATIRFYDAFAKAMLVQDKLNNYTYNQVMNDVFIKRGILRQSIKPMVNMNWAMFKSMIEPANEVIEDYAVSIVRTKSIELLTLPDFRVNVEAPNDTYYEFNQHGDCVDTIITSPFELVDHARNCVDFLYEKGLIRDDNLSPFEVTEEGNLIRSHFAGCFLANCTNPNQPEYLKCWKPENNSGCGCGGKQKPVCSTNNAVVTTQANTRLRVNGCGNSHISSGQNLRFNFAQNAKSRPVC